VFAGFVSTSTSQSIDISDKQQGVLTMCFLSAGSNRFALIASLTNGFAPFPFFLGVLSLLLASMIAKSALLISSLSVAGS
jgi:hypothetical protein